jgi:hypothetical protein
MEYFVLGLDDEYLRVINDGGEPVLHPKSLFEICSRSIPPEWQFREGDDGDYYLSPRRTAAPGFYEDYFASDGDLQAQTDAQRALHAVFEETLEWAQEEEDRLVIRRDLERLVGYERNGPTRPGHE